MALGLGLTLGLLWLLGGGTLPAHADSPHYVAPGGVCGGATPCHATIQEAVDAAVPGDEIRVAAGTYTDVHVRPRNDFITTGVVTQVVYISKTVTIHGGYTTTNWTTPHPITQPTTLDAQGQGRVLYITGDPSASSGQAISPTIEGLRITGGNATGLGGALGYDAGGGVYVISATATISNNRVFSNTAEYGGGLFLGYSDATLNGNTVFSNTATLYGGGLCLGYSNATLSSNTVFSNTAVSGGGLGLGYSDATLSGNTVFSNTAILYGGGLFLGDSPATFSDNAINGNTADAGGGLYLTGSDATLSGDTISENTATEDGGGLYLASGNVGLSDNDVISNTARYGGGLYLDSSPATLSGNTIISNTASEDGGGLCLRYSSATLNGNTIISNSANDSDPLNGGGGLYLSYDSDATLVNNLIADNQTGGWGSGLCILGSSPQLLHTTIARNTGGDGSGIYVTDGGWSPSIVVLTNTILVSHTVGITVTDGNTATLEATLWGTDTWANDTDWDGVGTIITGTRNYWGDPTFVDPDSGDYHIGATSAAIDKGVNAGVMTDIDGEARPDGCFFDIGADELITGVECKCIYLPVVLHQYP